MPRKVKVPPTWPERMSDHVTLAAAKAWLRDQVATGAECPCCAQNVQVYRRPIHARMARDLIKLALADPGRQFLHMPTVLGINGGDTAKLAYWGLLEEERITRADGGRAGWWRVTDLGMAFVRGDAMVQSHCFFYARRGLGLDGPLVDIRHCLGKRFDLRELLQRSGG